MRSIRFDQENKLNQQTAASFLRVALRIIGGQLKGRKLFKPRGSLIRPTADRTREAIFNILGSKVDGAAVLDLFAGTGAFGIEALSRGAATAVFVEDDSYAVSLIKRNVIACNLESQVKIIKLNALKYLHYRNDRGQGPDIVFLDPPYEKGIVASVLDLLDDFLSSRQSCVVVEHAISEPIIRGSRRLIVYDQRKYGSTLVSFLTHML